METLPRLMLVTDRRRTRGRDVVSLVSRAIDGGVRLVQVRERDLSERDLDALVRQLRRVAGSRARILVNGHSRVARNAHGLHLSAEELPLPAHHWEDGEWLVGRSASDAAEVRAALDEEVSYIQFRTVFGPRSGANHGDAATAALRRIVHLAHPTPIYASGEITISRIPELVHAGVWGVAVKDAILGATHPRGVAEAMVAALRVATGPCPG